MVEPIHHFHKRKRIHEKHEEYPHPQKIKRFLDKTIYAAGIAGPILTIPQFHKIWFEKNAAGVSLMSWSAYLIIAFFWLAYGIAHKEKPIIVTYIGWIIIEIAIVLGIIIYG